jgi:hypothetical protein
MHFKKGLVSLGSPAGGTLARTGSEADRRFLGGSVAMVIVGESPDGSSARGGPRGSYRFRIVEDPLGAAPFSRFAVGYNGVSGV